MEILEAYDLTGSFRAAAEMAGCDHKTVAHWVAVREATGGQPAPSRCPQTKVYRASASLPESRLLINEQRRP